MNKKIFLTIFSLLFALSIFAQKSTIRGFITDKNTSEPIMFCNVSIEAKRASKDIGSSLEANLVINLNFFVDVSMM